MAGSDRHSRSQDDLHRNPRDLSHSAVAEASPTLRSLAAERGLLVGAAVNVSALDRDTEYGEVLARELSLVVAENAMKFRYLQPQRNRFDFAVSDRLMAFAADRHLQVRGHTLVWHRALPAWLEDGDWTRAEAMDILKRHIETVVGRYRNGIIVWDVANEAIAADGTLRDSFWLRHIGPEYVEMAFRWAHAADPEARLFYNDYGGEELGRKSDAIYALVRSLRARGVPIHGVGLQMHVRVDAPPDATKVAANMRRLADLGLEVQITEMDVRLPQPAAAKDYEQQGEVYRRMLRTCLQESGCSAFVTWGLSDRYSWVPGHFAGWGEALLFDERYRAKPAYYELSNELSDLPK